jgi:UDP-N-acetyl-D-glucosamine dehydrogenase
MGPIASQLLERIEENRFTVGILGLGYVGLPLAVQFAKRGIKTIGFEKSESRAYRINKGENYIADIDEKDLQEVIQNGQFFASVDFAQLKECDAIIICVPTPLDRFKKPDMSYIETAAIDIGRNIKPGTLVALESTTYPTTTESFLLPIIERESALKAGQDFWLCFSAERVDPGNKIYKTSNTPKVLGAMGEESKIIAAAVYSKAIEKLHLVSTPRVAEMTKILENTYRLVNISLINEMALLCGKMDINIWEVIEAAKTKPYGFQAFYPGPGIGGHCIPLDPFYLEYIAKNYNFDLTMINAAGHIDNLMPHRMVIKIASALNRQCKSINSSKILFIGVAYKPDIDDVRESPALRIMEEVAAKGGLVSYHDPFVPAFVTEEGLTLESMPLTPESLSNFDCAVVTTKHSSIDYEMVVNNTKVIVDLRNAIPHSSEGGKADVYRL